MLQRYNEAERLAVSGFGPLVDAGMEVLFINDGSTDRTGTDTRAADGDIRPLVGHPPASQRREAEAVRAALRAGVDRGATIVAYLDPGLATPASEFIQLIDHLDEDLGHGVVLGPASPWSGGASSDGCGGTTPAECSPLVQAWRSTWRSTNTQCGAKVFLVSPSLRTSLDEPFSSRWPFDVELIGRLLRSGTPVGAFVKVALAEWSDRPGGMLTLRAAVRATAELPMIAWKLRKR